MTPLVCSQVDELLVDYLYDELGAAERQAVDEHLAGCPRCASSVAGFRRVREATRALPVEEPSPQVSQRLLEAAAGRNVVPLPLATRAEPVAPLAAVARARAAKAQPPASTGGPQTLENSASVAAQVIAAARSRARRWYTHPAWSAAAVLTVGLFGTMWMLTYNRDAVQRPAPALPELHTPASTEAPQKLEVPVALENELPRAPEATTAAAAKAAAPAPVAGPASGGGIKGVATAAPGRDEKLAREAEDRGARVTRDAERGESLATGADKADRAPTIASAAARDDEGGAADPFASDARRRGGGAAGYGAAPPVGSSRARSAPDVVAAKPAPPFTPPQNGKWLADGQKEALERSVAEQAKKRAQAAPPAAVLDHDRADEALAKAEPGPPPAEELAASPQGGRWAQPPPPPRASPAAAPSASRGASASGSVAAADAPAAPAASPRVPPTQAVTEAAPPARRAAPGAKDALSRDEIAEVIARSFVEAFGRRSCSDGMRRYRELRARTSEQWLTHSQRFWVAMCMSDAGEIQQARLELASLRADAPDLSGSIDQLLGRIQYNDMQAQRKALPSQTPESKAKRARPAKAASQAAPTD